MSEKYRYSKGHQVIAWDKFTARSWVKYQSKHFNVILAYWSAVVLFGVAVILFDNWVNG